MNEFSYLLPPLQTSAVGAYLKRIGVDMAVDDDSRYHYLFVCYSPSPSPKGIRELSARFPEICRLDRHPFLGSRLVAVLNCSSIEQVSDCASKLHCSQVADGIRNGLRSPPSPSFKLRGRNWTNGRPRIMGILNVTPDSFYDGGLHYQKEDYTALARKMIEAGADAIDIGGESTRPGSKSVDEREELKRILPALTQIRRNFDIPISVDTVKPNVADEALRGGADLVNDVSGLKAGRAMLEVVKRHRASYCLMHTQGNPETMQIYPTYTDVLAEVYSFFRRKLEFCRSHGLERERILLDPGIGFGKRLDHNLDLLRFLSIFCGFGCLVLQGSSNKSFIGTLLGRDIEHRVSGTLASQALGWGAGATVFRVHQVAENRDATGMAAAYAERGSSK